jgi:hypothetical protein
MIYRFLSSVLRADFMFRALLSTLSSNTFSKSHANVAIGNTSVPFIEMSFIQICYRYLLWMKKCLEIIVIEILPGKISLTKSRPDITLDPYNCCSKNDESGAHAISSISPIPGRAKLESPMKSIDIQSSSLNQF